MDKLKDEKLEVSVVIPVFNAAPFLKQAVTSAITQPEVREVILVEDCSSDDSLAMCQELASLHEQVKLFQHTGGINRGAGPSRNLAITKSSCRYIAFLDADDFYLPGRFTAAKTVFALHPDCDGVYDAVGMHYEDEVSRDRWREFSIVGEGVTTVQPGIEPSDLFDVLTKGGRGHIHLNGLTVKRDILEKSSLFSTIIGLESMHEDTDFILRLSSVGSLHPGNIKESVAMRRVHQQNRVSEPRSEKDIHRDRMRLRVATYRWLRKNGTPQQYRLAFRRLLLEWKRGAGSPGNFGRLKSLLRLPFRLPSALIEGHYWFTLTETGWAIVRNDWLKLK